MDGISVYSEDSRTTWVPNEFIDYYMPRANGTFVKVYLYLLRCLTAPMAGFGVSAIADALEETEKDILRALRYWEREQVLTLTWAGETELSGIRLLRLSRPSAEQATGFVSSEDMPFSSQGAAASAPLASSERFPADRTETAQAPRNEAVQPVRTETAQHPQNEAVQAIQTGAAQTAQTVTTQTVPAASVSRQLPEYSADRLEAFSENAETAWLIRVVEQYLERMPTSVDVRLILFLHDELHFSNELILHLYEYCVSRGKKAASYIQKVAISWYENGVDTVEKAETASLQFDANFSAVNRAFALNRAPGIAERRYITRWNSFGFGSDIIEEACSRTLLRISKPDFKYADSILEEWHQKGVHSLADIKQLDRDHAARQNAAVSREPSRTTNRFNTFPQRDYSGSELSELEKALLGNGPQTC